ncbi:alpha-amylase [Treponema primitia ZAS-2]|uniref:Alpha-amylase n=1 Tax=Treponema primitia (strain ATCC BAA-887 / DSM 12427 / ZAS-2) TaxID=545694 RepID=F5YM35_TREPZ|nr:alpha-amylase/4-alpha-glucanotransferase domain-containing protein [Treponema primitia]AEF86734.1 alpha-amylase [Treponema primitia ZAS-2]
MNEKPGFILGSHNHIPIGSGDDEGEYLYATRLKPFIQTLNQYPKIPAALHYSGSLLTWLENSHPELTMLLGDMISRKQVEILGGGFYEPMMPLLPQSDKIGQIEMLTAYLRKKFGKRPQGCWIPGAAWEQQLVGVLNTCGMGYTFLDEDHFGVPESPDQAGLSAPVISENQGKISTVFPLAAALSWEFTRENPKAVLERLIRNLSPGALVTVFPNQLHPEDPGETPETTYGRFFEALAEASKNLEFTTPGKVYKTQGKLKKAYFPGDQERKFLIAFPEANGIYVKMIFTHSQINQLRGDKSRKQSAREELWKAQGYSLFCDADTHGGIRRSSFRKAAYKSILAAEKICRTGGKFVPSLLAFDFDLDGRPEYLFQDRNINCYVKSSGASIFELDYLPKTWNYLDTFSRRLDTLQMEPGIEDGYRRTAFVDRLVPPDFSFKDALEGRFAASRFCGKDSYELVEMDRSHGKAAFRLPVNKQAGTTPYLSWIEIEKSYVLKQDTLMVRYALINRGEAQSSFKFIPQLDLSFSGDGEELLKVYRSHAQDPEPAIRGGAEISNVRGIEFRDIKNELTLGLTADRDFNAWILPIRTKLKIRDTVTDQYQSTCLMPALALSLKSEERWETEFKLTISH